MTCCHSKGTAIITSSDYRRDERGDWDADKVGRRNAPMQWEPFSDDSTPNLIQEGIGATTSIYFWPIVAWVCGCLCACIHDLYPTSLSSQGNGRQTKRPGHSELDLCIRPTSRPVATLSRIIIGTTTKADMKSETRMTTSDLSSPPRVLSLGMSLFLRRGNVEPVTLLDLG